MKKIISEFVKFAEDHSDVVPDYVADATVHTFANLDNPRNKAEVFLSAFAKHAGERTRISPVDLLKRARILGIDRHLEILDDVYNAPPVQVKQAAVEEYPIRSLVEWKKAASWIEKNGYLLPVEERREIAEKVVKKAEEYGQEPSPSIEAMAGRGRYHAATVVSDIVKRAELLRNRRVPNLACRHEWIKAASYLDELAEYVAEYPVTSEQSADKIASAIQHVDNDFDLYQYYGSRLKEPDVVVRSVSDRVEQDLNRYAVKLADGSVYDRRDFSKLNVVKVAKYFGSDTAWDMLTDLKLDTDKVASVVETWELPEVEVFQGLLEEQGICPKVKTAEALFGKKFIEFLAQYE